MIARHGNYRFVRFSVLAAALMSLAAWPAAAGDLDKLDTALKLVPADAAFYAGMLRNREQFEAVVNSKAFAKIKAMPVVQMGLAVYEAQLDFPRSGPAQLEAALKNPETRKVLDLAADMASDEIFIYGDENFVDFVKLFQVVNAAQSYGPLVAQITGQAHGRRPQQIQAGLVISALAKNVELIGVPNLIVGFKLKNTDLAKEQLIKLEMIVNIVLENNELTKGRFKKTKLGDHEYLVLELDGSMIPWDEMPLERFQEMEAEEGDVWTIIDRLKESKLVVAIGVRGDYLLCSIGSSLACLEKLGQDQRLVDRPEFKPLEKYADRRLISLSYLSQAMNRQFNTQKKDVDNLLELVDQLLPEAELTDGQKEQIRNDAKSLAEDFKTMIPNVGAMTALSFLTDRGVEGYQYVWGDHGRIDGSQPLDLLQHVGGDPILGVAARQKVSLKDYDLMVKWAKTAYGYFKELGLPLMPPSDRERVEQFLAAALPLVERMDTANRELLIPALADGQLALVVDAKLESKHFIEDLPATEKPMPMIEPAIVVGLSDAKLFKKALGEYRAIVNGLIDAARQIEDSNVPEDVQIPAPQVTEGGSGTIYSFALPEQLGVDEKIVPNVGVSEQVAVVSASRDHTERLLKATPLAVGGVLARPDRPLAVAFWLDWAALVEAAAPWVDFAVEQNMASRDDEEDQQKIVADQVHTGLDVLQSLRTITNESYFEDGVLVNHALLEIHDVEK